MPHPFRRHGPFRQERGRLQFNIETLLEFAKRVQQGGVVGPVYPVRCRAASMALDRLVLKPAATRPPSAPGLGKRASRPVRVRASVPDVSRPSRATRGAGGGPRPAQVGKRRARHPHHVKRILTRTTGLWALPHRGLGRQRGGRRLPADVPGESPGLWERTRSSSLPEGRGKRLGR